MKKLLLTVALILTTILSCLAKEYRIVYLNKTPITIGGKQCKAGDKFSDTDGIVWEKDQVMGVIDAVTGEPFMAQDRENTSTSTSTSPKMTLKNFLNHKIEISSRLLFPSTLDFFLIQKNAGSSRDPQGKKIAEFIQSPVNNKFPEKRAALVMGNSNYPHLGNLRNSQGDAASVSNMLLSLGFDVMQLYEGDFEEMQNALIDFGRHAKDADLILFYYAGHGIQYNGKNYLVPVDRRLELSDEVDKCLSCNSIKDKFETMGARNSLIVLDACRNTPNSLTRGVNEGLAGMEAGRSSIILFSTESGRVAADGNGIHSPFAEAFLEKMPAKGREMSAAVRDVVKDTQSRTQGSQRPLQTGTLDDDIFLNPTDTPVNSTSTTGNSTGEY